MTKSRWRRARFEAVRQLSREASDGIDDLFHVNRTLDHERLGAQLQRSLFEFCQQLRLADATDANDSRC